MFRALELAARLLHGRGKTLPFSKHKEVGQAQPIFVAAVRAWLADFDQDRRPRLLDVGGAEGEQVRHFLGDLSQKFDICVIDILHPQKPGLQHIQMDITGVCPPELIHQFDIVYSFNALEHFSNPIIASDNMCKLLAPGGLCLVHTVFSWRYHPAPKDYYRFSDDALRNLFSERNGLSCEYCGYDISRRREDIRGGYFGDRDVPPLDFLGGFRENWSVYYCGRKQK